MVQIEEIENVTKLIIEVFAKNSIVNLISMTTKDVVDQIADVVNVKVHADVEEDREVAQEVALDADTIDQIATEDAQLVGMVIIGA